MPGPVTATAEMRVLAGDTVPLDLEQDHAPYMVRVPSPKTSRDVELVDDHTIEVELLPNSVAEERLVVVLRPTERVS